MKYQRNKLKLDDFEEDGNEVTWADMETVKAVFKNGLKKAIKIERAPVCKVRIKANQIGKVLGLH